MQRSNREVAGTPGAFVETSQQCFFGEGMNKLKLVKRTTLTPTSSESISTELDVEPYEGDLLLVRDCRMPSQRVIEYYSVDAVEEAVTLITKLKSEKKAYGASEGFDLRVWHTESVGMKYGWYPWRCQSTQRKFREWIASNYPGVL